MAEQHGIKQAFRELCAAIGVAPPPAIVPVAPPPAAPVVVQPQSRSETVEPWGQPGRKTLKEETQEVKRNVEGVQADVGDLRQKIEQIRVMGGFEWPQPLRAEGAAATVAVTPGVAPVQAVPLVQGRNTVQVGGWMGGFLSDDQLRSTSGRNG